MQTDLAGSNLTKANLKKADLTKANINTANLENANLQGANLTKANLDSANLENANLQEANLTKASLDSADIENANLQEADLKLTDISDSDLSEANLTNAYLVGAELVNANLRKVCLEGASLEAANLYNADLIGANLNGANLRKADLTDANIYGATFDNADLTDAIMPDGEIYNLETSTNKQLKRRKSMERQIIQTESAPAPVGPYNQAIAATGKMLFVSGQIAIDTRLNEIVYTDDVAKQTEQVMTNLEAVLTAAGAQWSNVVKTTVFLKDMNDFATVNGVYGKYFDPDTAPARACVEVSRLPKDVLVEIDCIAVI
ncbi:MAG: endoribonuclease L-PSP [Okeania sp. SIO2H7]|nr:endoribonuclease L-PSP [Okeania sp. SIO2H7]